MKKYIIVAVIALIGIISRFYDLGDVPPSLNWDEVSIGYNAYSVLKTGRDEYGELLPLSFRSFGDYKQPLYVYFAIPSIFLFDLTPFAVRLPSALFGSLSIVFVFFLVYELFFTSAKKTTIASLTALLYSISPWSIQFSRFASEANVALSLTLGGVWLVLRGTRIKSKFMILISLLFFILSMYTYHSHKIFTPFILLSILWLRKDYFLSNKRFLGILIALFFLGNIFWLVDANTTQRGRSVLLTSEQTQLLEQPIKYLIEDKKNGDILGVLLHNRRIIYLKTYLKNYLSHFDPNFLLMMGDNARHHAPDMGVVYLVSLPFIIFGFLSLWKRYKKEAVFLSLWLLGAPAVSALAINAPSAIRSMMFLPLWQIFAAFGIISFLSLIKHQTFKYIGIFLIILFYFLNIFYYFHQYFVHTNREYARYWQYGYKEAIEYALSLPKNTPIIFNQDIEQAQTFYLFYAKVDPSQYLLNGGSKRMRDKCSNIDNIYFGECLTRISSGFLITGNPPSISAKKMKTILYPNGEEALAIYFFAKKY
ncbi:MAG: hypothetical protein KatS3mg089_0390 [Patescibacteria group bacterium]|nr:MAG: hypothetical protein KatS3mg089_0390 [Patescibacteria group bacterium]